MHAAAEPVGPAEPLEPAEPFDGLDDLDTDDAFGHPALTDAARDDAVWSDGDEDDIDV